MKHLFIAACLQRDFMNKDGALYMEDSEIIKPNVREISRRIVSKMCTKQGIRTSKVITILDYHKFCDQEISLIPDFAKTFPQHCMRDTVGGLPILEAQGVYDISDVTFRKDRISVFQSNPDFIVALNAYGSIDNIYVFGSVGEFGVRAIIDGLILYKGNQVNFENLYIIEDCIAVENLDVFDSYLSLIISQHEYIKVLCQNELSI